MKKDVGLQRGVDCEIPHRLKRRTKHFFTNEWKPLPNIHNLEILRGNSTGKLQREPYLLVGLSCYDLAVFKFYKFEY